MQAACSDGVVNLPAARGCGVPVDGSMAATQDCFRCGCHRASGGKLLPGRPAVQTLDGWSHCRPVCTLTQTISAARCSRRAVAPCCSYCRRWLAGYQGLGGAHHRYRASALPATYHVVASWMKANVQAAARTEHPATQRANALSLGSDASCRPCTLLQTAVHRQMLMFERTHRDLFPVSIIPSGGTTNPTDPRGRRRGAWAGPAAPRCPQARASPPS